MKDSEGIILTSPTYIMHVSSQMKKFLDRFSSLCHRPEFYYHHGLSIVTTGGIGEKISGKYLRDVLTI